ncbi:Deoxycytidylate deaminase [Dufourea novaeangliae]|uniref:Probable deoxycytidylate deaminase n=1 Tax=Dufourea novaeangliae TaxID=178035 RepID=A0A154P6I9_DUFNO|nr:Deoxycytidylate deaminase [Dufourea novaeangliae]
MATAVLAAKRSKDPCTKVGACIVNDERRIVSVGYNGMPIGCSDKDFPWTKGSSNPLENKKFYVCHAEVNAILNKNCSDVKNCTMYVGLFPCNECAKVIIQSGIKTIIYMSDKHAHKNKTIAAKKMFDATGVIYRKYTPKNEKIIIDFTSIDKNEVEQTHEKSSVSTKNPNIHIQIFCCIYVNSSFSSFSRHLRN